MIKDLPKTQLDAELLRQRLTLRKVASERKLLTAHTTAKEFFKNLGLRPGKIREHAAKLITSGAVAGTLLLSTPPLALPIAEPVLTNPVANVSSPVAPAPVLQKTLAENLQVVLPPVGNWQLSPTQEEEIKKKIKKAWGINAAAELEGHRLNNAWGRMGAEQLLPRYPGDTAEAHGEFVDKGQTPGLGGWGYFAFSKELMTPELYDNEKWYVAVQTLYLPDWRTRTKELVEWYKYRRVVVVNPANGKTLVADVADAGPAIWTGKHFGGSPAVMAYLGINTGMQNHPVVLFFLDDSQKEIPVGPVEYNWEENRKLLADKD